MTEVFQKVLDRELDRCWGWLGGRRVAPRHDRFAHVYLGTSRQDQARH